MNALNKNSLATEEIILLEKRLRPYRRLPVCFANEEEECIKYFPIIRQLNRGIVILCAFSIKNVKELENTIIVEIEKPINEDILLKILQVLHPIGILIWKFNNKTITPWKKAIDAYGKPSINIDAFSNNTSLFDICKKINQLLWDMAYKKKHVLFGLNIGCGTQPLSGWINVDLAYKYPSIAYMDARRPFPYPDESFMNVFSEHMFEHLSFKMGVGMLKEVWRILAEGGTLVLSVPVLDFLINIHTAPDTELHKRYVQWSMSQYDSYVAQFYSTEKIPTMFIINNFMRFWNHQMIYDTRTLTSLLHRIGFRDVKCMGVEEFQIGGVTLEKHGEIIPNWANRLESKSFIAHK